MFAMQHLRIRGRDLPRLADFYHRQLGFAIVAQTADRVELATAPGGPPLLTLEAAPAAPASPPDAAGLFHAALLLPSRAALGGWLKRAISEQIEFGGFADHGVSEALYLADPEGNGLEIYSDRPKSAWPIAADGTIAMFTRALDVPDLLAAASAPGPQPLAGARWGHLHLRVTELDRSEKFYHDSLGLVLTQGSYPGVRFMAAEGYHHHLGLNIWGRPRHSQPVDALGLAEATFACSGATEPASFRDPDGIAIRLIGGE